MGETRLLSRSARLRTARSGPGRTRIRNRAFVLLMGIFVASFLPGCSSGGDERSDSSSKATEQPATSQAQESASQDTTTGQAPSAKAPADATPQTATTPQAGSKTSARADTAAAPVKPPTLGEVLARHNDELRAIRGVLSVDSVACDVGPCIQVTVTRRTQSILSQLPATIEGYQVVVKERHGEH